MPTEQTLSEKTLKRISFELLQSRNGQHIGTSRWFDVTQEHMNMFGVCTQDIDPQHMDPEWAKNSPFNQTIAYGFWTVSMIAAMSHDIGTHKKLVNEGPDTYPLNYGFDRLRLLAPVPVGARVRLNMVQKSVERRGGHDVLFKTLNTVEIESHEKPAMLAEWLFMLVNLVE